MVLIHLEPSAGEAAHKNDLLGRLADVDESSTARSAWREI